MNRAFEWRRSLYRLSFALPMGLSYIRLSSSNSPLFMPIGRDSLANCGAHPDRFFRATSVIGEGHFVRAACAARFRPPVTARRRADRGISHRAASIQYPCASRDNFH